MEYKIGTTNIKKTASRARIKRQRASLANLKILLNMNNVEASYVQRE